LQRGRAAATWVGISETDIGVSEIRRHVTLALLASQRRPDKVGLVPGVDFGDKYAVSFGFPSREFALMSAVAEREVEVLVELGRTVLTAEAARGLTQGCALPLDSASADPVDVYADGELVARGELLVRDKELFVRVLEIIRHSPAS
jgi:hypothetical protein